MTVFIHLIIQKEIEIILNNKSKNILILCDNIEMGSGKVFNQILKHKKKLGYAFKNFAGFNL